jgi:uncharacterized protein YgfB (UPF0149 family)
MSTLNEDIRAIMAKMPEDQRHKFITAAYTDIVGYDPFTDDVVTMSLELGEVTLVGMIEEHVSQGAKDEVFRGLVAATTVGPHSVPMDLAVAINKLLELFHPEYRA